MDELVHSQVQEEVYLLMNLIRSQLVIVGCWFQEALGVVVGSVVETLVKTGFQVLAEETDGLGVIATEKVVTVHLGLQKLEFDLVVENL